MIATPRMILNGEPIATYNLKPLEGTLDAILQPAPFKKLVTNDSSCIHGTIAISTPAKRFRDKQDLSLSFLVNSTSAMDLQEQLQYLERDLIRGKYQDNNQTGINELVLPDYGICLRLIYIQMSKVTPWFPLSKAVITLKFTEPNPENRAL